MKKEKEKEARWDEGVRNDGVDEYNSIIIAKKEQLKRLVIFLSYRKKKEDKKMPFPSGLCGPNGC